MMLLLNKFGTTDCPTALLQKKALFVWYQFRDE